jgi:hypothetical protein
MSRNLMLLSYTGPKSGKRYTLPVAYVQQGDTVYVATDSRWGRSLRGVPVELRLRGASRRGSADLITDEAGMTAAFRTMLAQAPMLGEIAGVATEADGTPRAADIASARQRGFMVIRIVLAR